MIPLRAIAPFVRKPHAAAGARCDLCGAPIDREHRHLVDVAERRLKCACPTCALLFAHEGQRLRVAPDRWLCDTRATLDDGAWSTLQIPVRLAFFFRHGDDGQWRAFYPGPAGATESTLPLDAWPDFAAAVPLASEVARDVEALLVRGDGHGSYACFVVPITACYELVGRVKRCWRGFDGGEEAWRAIDGFFDRVRARCEAT